MSKQNRPLVVILGPTAVGKSEFAISLAERCGGEIVSADSRLLYRGMDIGTAKPTADERRHVPHHLVDVAEPDETWSLAKFKLAARQAIDSIHARGNLPFLVGGTGQYLQAVIENWVIPRVPPDPLMRQVLEGWSREIGTQGLHHRLSQIDPKAAEKIDYRNLRRTIRALEVIFHTGKRFSEQSQAGPSLYHVFKIGLERPRDELYDRIDARIEAMLDAGFIDEVGCLLEKGYSADLPAFSAIGYRQIAAYLRGEHSLDEAVALIKRQTRVFVRRQANWFKKDDPTIHWYNAETVKAADAEDRIREWLSADR